MADESSDGMWKAAFAGLSALAAVVTALLRRPAADDNNARAANLDRMHEHINDGLRLDIQRMQAQAVANEARAELWERRARRADEHAHVLWHIVAPMIMLGTVNSPGFSRIPLLEDPL
jgi:hypothetical protein